MRAKIIYGEFSHPTLYIEGNHGVTMRVGPTTGEYPFSIMATEYSVFTPIASEKVIEFDLLDFLYKAAGKERPPF